MKLTDNFTLEEFTHSNTAIAKGIDNTPNGQQVENLRILCARVLQPLREAYNEPFFINSGFRCPELNKAVGGVPPSQHLEGKASDVRVKEPRKLLAELLKQGLSFDQAILYPTFLHISYNSGLNRKDVLYAKGVKP